MAKDLLFLSQRIPYPPNKGDKVRSWNMLSRLAKEYRVHLGCFIDDPEDWQYTGALENVCASCCFIPLNSHWAKLRASPALLTGEALTVPHFRDRRLVEWLRQLRRTKEIETVFVYSSGVADYVMNGEWTESRRVVDMVDVDSDKWRQYSDGKSGIAKWVYRREGEKLLTFERDAAAQFDATIFVSDNEADLFRTLAPECSERVCAISNGVDAEFFDPDLEGQNPYSDDECTIAFTGAMDYWPNADAVVWFVDHVMPQLKRRWEKARFYIVGANPGPEVAALGTRPGVTVTGRVDDIRPYIRHANVIVAPLRIARGVQNKVLEGMAMRRVVVASPLALEGLSSTAKDSVIEAETPEQFVAAIDNAIAGEIPASIGTAARECVKQHYSWDAFYRQLQVVLQARAFTAPTVESCMRL